MHRCVFVHSWVEKSQKLLFYHLADVSTYKFNNSKYPTTGFPSMKGEQRSLEKTSIRWGKGNGGPKDELSSLKRKTTYIQKGWERTIISI